MADAGSSTACRPRFPSLYSLPGARVRRKVPLNGGRPDCLEPHSAIGVQAMP